MFGHAFVELAVAGRVNERKRVMTRFCCVDLRNGRSCARACIPGWVLFAIFFRSTPESRYSFRIVSGGGTRWYMPGNVRPSIAKAKSRKKEKKRMNC